MPGVGLQECAVEGQEEEEQEAVVGSPELEARASMYGFILDVREPNLWRRRSAAPRPAARSCRNFGS